MTSAPCRIRALPPLLINKIAAGEVVERPASVVKELVDNAIDAGATRITVTIEDGGKQLIRVTDNGGGMSAEELGVAVMPHTTSKIASEDDLYAIATMGFRGEALASVSAVSKLRVVSRQADELEGNEIRVVGKTVESSQAAGCPPGTTVEVRDLFFNVPARRKFLRARSTEVGHINEQVGRAAIAFPDISFEVTNNGRVTQNLPACGNRLDRIARFYSPELADALIPLTRDERGISLEAYLGPPAQSRANAQWQYTYLNGRYIRDRYLQHAMREAYRGLMEPNRHAVVFLFLGMDPAEVDVNVHPMKTEVRWANSNLVHSQVLSALRETLQRANLTPSAVSGLHDARHTSARLPADRADQDCIRREMAAALKATPPIQPGSDRAGFGGGDRPGLPGSPSSGTGSGRPTRESMSNYGNDKTWRSLYSPPSTASKARSGEEEARSSIHPDGAEPSARRPRAVQLHNLYLVTEAGDGIVIVDQHALHERIIYEQLHKRMSKEPLESQRLLLPETITVTPEQIGVIESNAGLLHRLGIEVTRIGGESIAVQAFPVLLKDTDVVPFMRDLLDYLAQQGGPADPEAVVHGVLDMMACKAAVKAGDPLADEEIESLLRQRHLVERSSACPHGRPTALHLSRTDLDRRFKRT
ncbi:MAG: DNA mismatch repair endonuclease MutL [Planctomycetes bacterium]|nr:DNA mismatch repair endonuclease MutL [Planctomycetota bacterium]